jgi:hypothetical protein
LYDTEDESMKEVQRFSPVLIKYLPWK